MNMIERFKNGWRLLMNSFDVMRRNPRLLLFPVATAALTAVMAGLFVTPIALRPTGHSYLESAHWKAVGSSLVTTGAPDADDIAHGRKESVSLAPAAVAYFVIFYFLSMFLATFFNVAFVHGIFNALSDKPVSVTEGLQFALTKLKPILLWTLFAGLVGMLIKTLEQKFGLFGRFIVRLVGVAWSVASVFVIPVLVLEEHPDNPIHVVRQSAGVITKAWGEALAGYAGLELGGLVIGFGSVAFIAAAIAAGFAFGTLTVTFGALALWLVFICAFSYVLSVASQIYLCVLYRYATTSTVPAGYTPDMLNMAWRPKKS